MVGGDVPLPGADDVGAHVPMLAAYTPIRRGHLSLEQSLHEAARCLLVRHCCQSSHDNLCIIMKNSESCNRYSDFQVNGNHFNDLLAQHTHHPWHSRKAGN